MELTTTKRQGSTMFGCFVVRSAKNVTRGSSSTSVTSSSSSSSAVFRYEDNSSVPRRSHTSQPVVGLLQQTSNSVPSRGRRRHFNNNQTNNTTDMNLPGDDLCSGFDPQGWRKDRCKKCFRLKEQHGTAQSSSSSSTPKFLPGKIKRFDRPSNGVPNTEPTGSASSNTSKEEIKSASSAPSWRQKVYGHNPPPLTKTQSDVGARFSLIKGSASSASVPPGDNDNDRETSPTPVPPQRKTKLTLIKAEISVDGNEPEEVSLQTSLSTDSLLSSPPPQSFRSTSPAGRSSRSDASSSAADYDTARSGNDDPMSRTVSYESVASTLLDDRSMVTAESGHSERSSTPTESLDETRAFVRSIRAQLEIMENKCAKLEEENTKLRRSSPVSFAGNTDGEIINNLKEKLTAADSLCQDYRDENTVLKCELRDLQESVSKHLDPEKKVVKDKLIAAEQLCEELMDENETLKKDVHSMQREIDEMHDQYREEEIDEFRDLQRELEQTAKNCRILQFKLRKSERRNDQTEADRQHLEEKLKELLAHSGGFDPSESPRLREMESELRIAKEVSVRLHNELETLEEKRCKLEDENFYFREKIREMEAREKLEHGRAKYEQKKSAMFSRGHSNISKDTNVNHNGTEYNVAQLLRDLQDACERETDLRDQLKFAENDIQASRKSLADLETENEGLMRQLAKFTSNPTGTKGGKPMMKRSYSEGHAQIELELAEHEAHTLKSKLEKVEKENECMISRISLLEREAKKYGSRTEFGEDEMRSAVPDTYYKQKIKMLEDEIDEWRLKFETMQKTEADQETARKTGKLVRSRFIDQDANKKDIDLKHKLEIVEQEANVLRQRISNLESDNERLTGENRRISFQSKKSNKTSIETNNSSSSDNLDSSKMKDKLEQMEKDIYRFINRIAELEKEKETLSKEVERRKKLESIKKETVSSSALTKFNPQTATLGELRDRVQELLKENAVVTTNLKTEQQRTSELDSQLGDYKQVISMSENQKLITMASKVEVLTNQLKEAQNRFENMHRKFSGLPNGSMTTKKYEDALKERIEILEKTLAEERARIKSNQTSSKETPKYALATPEPDDDVGSVEITQCNQVLATVEDQVDRIFKQVEQLEAQQKVISVSPKSSPLLSRYKLTPTKSLDAENAAEKENLLKDIATMKSELQSVKTYLRDRKKDDPSSSSLQEDLPANVSIKMLQKKCQQQEKIIGELKEQLEVSKQERMSAYHECETATARLLQTEDRWNKELEKLKESYENQVKDLKYYLQEAERVKDEKSTLLQERTSLLQEKNKRLTEIETKAQKLENDLKTKHRDLQDKMEIEKKRAKEFETKYQKLETLYESDRQKLNNEKEKFKIDLSDMKKKYDETQNDFEKLKISYEKKEQMWSKDKQDMETKIKSLQDEVKEVEKQAAKKAAETSSAENKKLLVNLEQLKKKLEKDGEEWTKEKATIQHDLERKSKECDFRLDEAERMKKELELMKSRVFDQKQQLEETRKMRDEAREELGRWQQTWARERSELAHKLRQEEKVQQVEQQSLQLKYESRIKVMEDSSKRFQTQLTQTRRERDQYRESLASAEKKIAESRQKYENDEKELRQRLASLEKQSEKVEDLEMQLEKEKFENKTFKKNYETDRRLWSIEKEQFQNKINELEKGTSSSAPSFRPVRQISSSQSSSTLEKDDKDKLVEQSMQIAGQLRQQIDDTKISYDGEVNNLRKQIDKSRVDWNKEKSEMQRKIKELQENMKVLEIDRRNMLSTKDQNELDKGQLQSERDTLMEKLHDSEIHQLANKYKLDKVADQMIDLQAKVRYGDLSNSEKRDLQDIVKKAIEQLMAVREDMGKTKELGKALESIDGPDDSASVASWRSGGVGSRKASGSDLDSTDRDSLEGILAKERLGPVGSEAETSSTQSIPVHNFNKTEHAPMPPTLGPPVFQTGKPYIATKSYSVSSEVGFEARIAELRLRSPSPSPRKITNYPDPPPSIIFNVKHAVEYDSEGRRHWTRRSQIKRSTSLDPNPANLAVAENSDVEDTQSTKSYLRSASAGGDGIHRLDDTPSIADSEPKTEKSSITSQSPSTRRKVIDIFATLRKSTSKERRKLFGDRKANSIESSDIGHTIGAMGVQVLPPAVTPSTLPNPLQKSEKLDDPPRLSKSTSGSRILDKIRGRSSSRGKLPRQAASVDTGSELSSGQGTPMTSTPVGSVSEFGTKNRTTSEENVIPKGTTDSPSSFTTKQPSSSSLAHSSRNSRTSSSPFRKISSSYSNVRSLSSRFLHRS